MPRLNVYIDGFNLYYGSLKNTQYKWLDVARLCETLFPNSTVNRIRYSTAHIKPLPHDPHAPDRQKIYFRALRTIPNLHVHNEGHFVHWPRPMPKYPLVYRNPNDPPETVMVLKAEEKGSDVNLACFLLDDCYSNDFDEAAVISDDSDLATDIELVVAKYGKVVHCVNPSRHRNRVSRHLARVSTSCLNQINRSVLRNCQFPSTLTDSRGAFYKPPTW